MANIYEADIENRFPLNTVALTNGGDVKICTITVTAGGAVVCKRKALTDEEALLGCRRILGVPDSTIPCLTTTQRGNVTGNILDGLQVLDTDDDVVYTRRSSGWLTGKSNAVSAISSATAYTLVDADFGGPPLLFDSSSAIAISVDTGLAAATEPCVIFAIGTGQITVGGTAVPNSSNGLKTRTRYANLIITYAGATDSWLLSGDTTAS